MSMELSVGTRVRSREGPDRVPEDKAFDVFQRHPTGGLPGVRRARGSGAICPAILVHGQGVVRFGALVFCTSAHEVDAIVHLTD
jgi:hypothetical protein